MIKEFSLNFDLASKKIIFFFKSRNLNGVSKQYKKFFFIYFDSLVELIKIIIGKLKFKLFTDEQWAFASNAATDNELVESMIRGAALIVRGISSRGTKTTDTYSLRGFTAAYKAIGKACKI